MAVVKLTDILPLTTTNVKESGRRPRKNSKRKPKYKFTDTAWRKKLTEFLKFCGWKSAQGDADYVLYSPNGKIEYCDGEFFNVDYSTDIVIGVDSAEEWRADDTNFILYKETGDNDGIVDRTVIKLK